MTKEIWKDLRGYEGIYRISSFGKVLSLQTGRLRKSYINNKGYEAIPLYRNGICKNTTVHRLVALTFVPNPHSYREVNHKDEDKLNNCADNLEWCSRKYNQEYSGNIQKWAKAGADGNMAASSIRVAQYTLKGELVETFIGTREAERATGIFHTGIGRCCLGKQKSAGGFLWAYV